MSFRMNFKRKISELVSILSSWQFWKSLLSGGITAVVDLSLLFVLREKLLWSYWTAVNTSFAASILVNFFLQKFWTFSSQNLDVAHKQFVKFLVVAVCNMAANAFLMFFLTVCLGVWYLGAQIITISLLVLANFVAYQRFVFR